MWRRRTRREWDRLAHYFDYLTASGFIPPWPPRPLIQEVLKQVQPGRILDCACGSGQLLVELKEEGYDVYGADISPGMIELAKKNAAAKNVHVPYINGDWCELPEMITQRFDLVLCLGNALSHCEGTRARQESLYAMSQMLNPGGVLIVDVRDWVKFRSQRERYAVRGPKYIMGKRVIMTVINTIPDEWDRPITTEFIVIEDGEKELQSEIYTCTYFPYNVGEVIDAMKNAGLSDVSAIPFDSEAGYFLIGALPAEE